METDILLSRIKEAIQFPKREEKRDSRYHRTKTSPANIVFCIKQQTRLTNYGHDDFKSISKKRKTVCYLKRINRKIKIQEETIYIAQRELAVTEQLEEKIPRLVLVEHWVATNEYENS